MRDVKCFGAVGDGVTKDTQAIQKAIDAGGMVSFPPGVYLSGTLCLKSNGGLFLEPGAVLLASPDKEDYNKDDFCTQNRVFASEHVSGAHFITAVEQDNVVICGGGRIDGNRQAFYGDKTQPDCLRHKGKFDHNELTQIWRPAQMVFFAECTNVRIQDVQLFNAPYWTCFLHGCEDVIISGLRILNDQRTYNGDGIDIDCCRRVAVTNCIIDSGDDCITLRGYDSPLKEKKPCEFVTISNCILHTNCNAFRIGVGDGIVRNAAISNIVFHDTRTAIAINSNYGTDPTKGVQIENITFDNLQIDADRAFIIMSQVRGSTPEPPAKEIRNIRFNHVRGMVTNANYICGCAGLGIYDIAFNDVDLDFIKDCENPSDNIAGPYGEWTKNSPPAIFYISHADGITFNKVAIHDKGTFTNWKYSLLAFNSKNIRLSDCKFDRQIFSDGDPVVKCP